jgi:protein-S-isoprenylcysteine O-methyltransferase Ste14
MTAIPSLLIATCWLIFIAYWFANALGVKPIAERESRLSNVAHRAPVVLGWVLLAFSGLPYPLNVAVTPHTDVARAIGAGVCLLGLFGAIWARRTLAGNWSSDVTFKQGHQLVQSGPYRFVRHPIYTAILLMCLGTAIAGGSVRQWLGLVMVCIGFCIKLRREEIVMLRHFPEEYPTYRNRVKALVPFIV